MRILHTSDWHLGFQAYRSQGTINQREMDVYDAVSHIVDSAIEYSVDVLVCAGDVFHTPEPTPRALLWAARFVQKLHEYNVHTLFVEGNHDAPRRPTSGSVLSVLERMGDSKLMSVRRSFIEPPVEIAGALFECWPNHLNGPRNSQADVDVLVLHGVIDSPNVGYSKFAKKVVRLDQLEHARYIAAGDYHHWTEIGHRPTKIFYSGSPCAIGSGPWDHAGKLQWYNVVDISDGGGVTVSPLIVAQNRFVFDLPMLFDYDADALQDAMRLIEDDQIVRVRVRYSDDSKGPSESWRAATKMLRKRMMHLHVDARPLQINKDGSNEMHEGKPLTPEEWIVECVKHSNNSFEQKVVDKAIEVVSA